MSVGALRSVMRRRPPPLVPYPTNALGVILFLLLHVHQIQVLILIVVKQMVQLLAQKKLYPIQMNLLENVLGPQTINFNLQLKNLAHYLLYQN